MAFKSGNSERTKIIFSSCFSSSTTIILALLLFAQYKHASAELVVYIPTAMPLKKIHFKHILKSNGNIFTYPANMAPRSAMNHSGLLKPKIHTANRLSRPKAKKAFAQVRTFSRYCLKYVKNQQYFHKIESA